MTDKKIPSAPTSAPAPEADVARRRLLLRGGAVAGGLAAFAAGYGETVARGAKGLISGTSGKATASATRGNSLTPELRIDPVTGQLTTQPGQIVSPSSCLGCWTQCGVRVRRTGREQHRAQPDHHHEERAHDPRPPSRCSPCHGR